MWNAEVQLILVGVQLNRIWEKQWIIENVFEVPN